MGVNVGHTNATIATDFCSSIARLPAPTRARMVTRLTDRDRISRSAASDFLPPHHRQTVMRMIKLAALLIAIGSPSLAADRDFVVQPPQLTLLGRFDRVQLLVTSGESIDERATDLTRQVSYAVEDSDIAHVDGRGCVTALSSGETRIAIKNHDTTRFVPVIVQERAADQIDFLRDVRPILSKAGCAAGACHAAQYGQGGFKLSVFGFDPQADYEAIARSSRGRRLNFASPEDSLLLRKPAMLDNHGGGLRLEDDSLEYEIVRDWIDAGASPTSKSELKVLSLEVHPRKRVGPQGFTQQLRVLADYSDGSRRDVTSLAVFDAIDQAVVSVGDDGYVHAVGKGQTGVMVRYEGQAAVSTFVVPYREDIELADWQLE